MSNERTNFAPHLSIGQSAVAFEVTGTSEWHVMRRKRTRQPIELGGLVVEDGLVDLMGDDRAKLSGVFLWMADKLRGEQGEHAAAIWQRRGRRAFEADALPRADASAIGTP